MLIFVSDMKKINRTYKFRLYLNNTQADLLARHFGCARFAYNYFLNQRKEQYRLTGKSDNYYTQANSDNQVGDRIDIRTDFGSSLVNTGSRLSGSLVNAKGEILAGSLLEFLP